MTAARSDIWLIAIAKTQRASVLANALQAHAKAPGEAPEISGSADERSDDPIGKSEADVPRPGDGEVLASTR